MNMSSESFGYPVNSHHRRVLTSHSSMLINASPVAVNNKIRAIQTRKPRITLQSYYDFTDIRPLNIGNTSGITNSSTTFSNLSPEKLVERSRDLRLGRISTRHHPRSSVLSTTSITNQTSLIWPNHNSPNGFTKPHPANSPTISPTALVPPVNKSSTGHIPDIHQRPSRTQTITRQPLTEQQNLPVPVELRHKSLQKTKSSIPKAYRRSMSKSKSPFPTSHVQPLHTLNNDYSKQSNNNNNNNNINYNNKMIHLYESEEDDENILNMDEEFEEYLQKAVVKCADWLIKYVFDKTYDEKDE